jgi:hypothetical protein
MTDRPIPPKKLAKSFADTSIAVKFEVGTSLHYEYLTDAIPVPRYINNYVRMEFYRTCLVQWIYLYFESAHSFYKTFGDAFKTFAEGFGRESKITTSALATIESDGFSFARSDEKDACRQKLQDHIFFLASQFREDFTDNGQDPTRCARISDQIKFPNESADRDSLLQQVAQTFRKEPEARARCRIDHLFRVGAYRSRLEAVSKITPAGRAKKALVKIQECIATAGAAPEAITCKLCSQMGDAVIACTLPIEWKLHSLDRVHEPISTALGLEYQIHPSDRALVKEAVKAEVAEAEDRPPTNEQ